MKKLSINGFFAAIFSLILMLSSGCVSKKNAPEPHTQDSGSVVDAGDVIIIPPVSSRTDLPSTWKEIRLDDWSYGVPSDFNSVDIDGGTILAHNTSDVSGLDITFEKVVSSISDLHQYVLSDFVLKQMTMGSEILQERTRTADGVETVAVQVLAAKPSGSQSQISSIDFFRVKGNTFYHLSCYGDISKIEVNYDVCFSISNTLLIN